MKIGSAVGMFSIILIVNLGTFTNAAAATAIIEDDFETYTNGSIVGQGGWVNYSNGSNFVVQSATSFQGNAALHNNAIGDSVITKTGTSVADGSQVVYVRSEGRSNWGAYLDGNAQVRISKGPSFASSIFLAASFKGDGNVAYYDPITDAYKNFATYSDNEWTSLEFEWRSSDKTVRYRVNGGTWTGWATFIGAASFTSFDNVGFDFILPSGTGGVYFDTLASSTVSISPPLPPANKKLSCTLTADKTEIKRGQSVTLTWTSANATSITLVADNGLKNVAPNGTMVVQPRGTRSYFLNVFRRALLGAEFKQCVVQVKVR